MNSDSFSIAYDGPALHEGTMDVRDLASALEAIGEYFDAANRALNGDRATVKISVVATKDGSFEIPLDVIQGSVQQTTDILTGDKITAVLNLIELLLGVSAVAAGLIYFVKKLKGRIPKPEELKFDKIKDDKVKVITEDDHFEIPLKVLKLYENETVRRSLDKLIAEPLEKDGINSFVAKSNGNQVTVEKSEAEYFKFKQDVPDNDPPADEIRTLEVSIVSLSFKEGTKWRLFHEGEVISATIQDTAFLFRVANNESFSKGDIMICKVKTKKYWEGSTPRTEHTVEEVVKHKKPPIQNQLTMGV